MKEKFWSPVFLLCISLISLIPQFATAQDSQSKVEEILSYLPAGLYSHVDYYDFEALRAAPSFDLYAEHFDWKKVEDKQLGPLPQELIPNVSSLILGVRVRFRISGLKADANGETRPEIFLDKDGNFEVDPNVTDLTFAKYGDTVLALPNYGRKFYVYRILALNELLKKAVKSGSIVKEEGTILGLPYYSIQSNPAGVPYYCCSTEPDVLLVTEDKSKLEDLVAVTAAGEPSLATEEYYDKVAILGSELGQTWSLNNWLMQIHPSMVRKLIDFGIPEELIQQRMEDFLKGVNFTITAKVLDSNITERRIDICGSEESAEKTMQKLKSRLAKAPGDEAPEAAKLFNQAFTAAQKFSFSGNIVTSDVVYDKDLLTLKTESEAAWQKLFEGEKKEKEAAAKKKVGGEKK